LQDFQRRQEFLAEIIAAAADAGQRGGRADDRTVAADGAVIRFDTPDRREDVAVDAIGALDCGDTGAYCANTSRPRATRSSPTSKSKIVPGRFANFRLRVEQVHNAQVRRQARGIARETGARDAAALGRRPQSGEAIAETRLRRHESRPRSSRDCRRRPIVRSTRVHRRPVPESRQSPAVENNRVSQLSGLFLRQLRIGPSRPRQAISRRSEGSARELHGERSFFPIGGRAKGHLLCYRTVNPCPAPAAMRDIPTSALRPVPTLDPTL